MPSFIFSVLDLHVWRDLVYTHVKFLLFRAAVTAVHDGYVLRKSITRAPIGGRLLDSCTLQSVESKGVVVRPSYSFKRHLSASGQWEVRARPIADTNK